MPSWPAYPGSAPRSVDAGPSPLAAAPLPTAGTDDPAALGDLRLGPRFDDARWQQVLRSRGWEPGSVGPVPGWVSPPMAGLRILFACPHLDVSGLDSSRLYVGFRADDQDSDECYVIDGGGDGELIFDRLLHADGRFDREAFLAWVRHGSMATLRRVP